MTTPSATPSASGASRSDRVSWDRKRTAIEKLAAQSNGIAEQIMDLHAAQHRLMDEIGELRAEMVAECIHPVDLVIDLGDGTQRCKFCEKTFRIVDQ